MPPAFVLSQDQTLRLKPTRKYQGHSLGLRIAPTGHRVQTAFRSPELLEPSFKLRSYRDAHSTALSASAYRQTPNDTAACASLLSNRSTCPRSRKPRPPRGFSAASPLTDPTRAGPKPYKEAAPVFISSPTPETPFDAP